MANLLVGDADCSYNDLALLFNEPSICTLKIDWWTELAMHLHIPPDSVEKWQKDLLLDKLKHIDVILKVLINWRMIKSNDATLGALYEAIPRDKRQLKELLQAKIREKAKFWDDLDTDSQSVVMQSNVKFLGRNYSLSSIRDMMDENKLYEIMNKMEMAEMFQKSFKKENWELGQYEIPKPLPYYIQRKLTMKRRLNPAIFKHKCSDVFLIEGIEKHHLTILAFQSESTDISSDQIKIVSSRFILLQHQDDYNKITKVANSPVHRIKLENDQFFWVSSSGCSQVIRMFLANDVEEFFETNFVEDHLSTFNNRPIAICSSPGMGKTVLLANLANEMKKVHPKRIIVYLELRSLIPELLSVGPEVDSDNVKRKLISCPSLSYIGNEIVLEFLFNQDWIFEVFLDGFDEISLEHLELAKQLIRCLLESPNMRVYITSRPHMQNEIENALEVISLDIFPFNQANQVKFLRDFWNLHQNITNQEKLSEFALKVLESLEFINDNMTSHAEFAGIPLQCFMLAQVYGNDAKMHNNREDFNFRATSSLYELYTEFMALKFERIEKCDRNLIKMYHWKEALMLLFPDNPLAAQIVEKLTNTVGNGEVPWNKIFTVGILEMASDKPNFVHRTFAEYLLAEFIVEKLINEEADRNILVKFLIDSVLDVYETRRGQTVSRMDLQYLSEFMKSSNTWTSGKLNLKKLKSVLTSQCNYSPEGIRETAYAILFKWLLQMGSNATTDKLDNILKFLGCNELVYYLHQNVYQINHVLAHEVVCSFVDAALRKHEHILDVNKQRQGEYASVCLTQSRHNLEWILLKCTEYGYQFLTQIIVQVYRDTSICKNVMDYENCKELLVRASFNDNVAFFKCMCDAVKSLLDFNFNDFFKMLPFEKNGLQRTPLCMSIMRGNYKVVEYLIRYIGKDIKGLDDLWLACFFDNWNDPPNVITNKIAVLRLLKALDEKFQKDEVQKFQIDKVQKLFPHGIDLSLLTTLFELCDHPPTKNNVPFMAISVSTCCKNDAEMDNLVNWLISRNLVHLLTHEFEPNLCILNQGLFKNLIKPQTLSLICNEHNFDFGIIFESAVLCERSEAIIKTIVELSGNVDQLYEKKNTLLHYAALHRKVNVMDYLLSSGACANSRDNAGNTPLHYVFKDKNLSHSCCMIHDAVNLLVTYEADVSATNIAGLLPLDVAKAQQDEMSIEEKTIVLLENSGSPNTASWCRAVEEFQSSTNCNAYVEAFKYGCFFVWVLNITQTSKNMNLSNPLNATLLHIAALFGEQKALEYLLSNGADANSKDKNGGTPLQYIFDWDYRNRSEVFKEINESTQWIHGCVELLLNSNAKVSVKNIVGTTPLALARARKDNLKVEDRTMSLLVERFQLEN